MAALLHQLGLESLIDSSVPTPCVLGEHLALVLRAPVGAVAARLAASVAWPVLLPAMQATRAARVVTIVQATSQCIYIGVL